jgi:Putative prokaryotic signal transducing protein
MGTESDRPTKGVVGIRLPDQPELQSECCTLEAERWNAPIGEFMNDRPAARPNPAPNPNEKLVRVFDTEQESEALVVRGLLESTGIDSDITSLEAQQDILPGVGGTVILVREEDAAEAKRVIEEYRRAPGSDETAEIDISGLPPEEA